MTEVEIKQLLKEKRFSDVGLKNIYLFIYFPIGLIIVILRLVIGILIWILGNILPDTTLTRQLLTKLLCGFFGIVIRIDKAYNKKNVRVVICNQISPLDHFIVHNATDSVMPSSTNLCSPLSSAIGMHNFNMMTTNVDEIKKCIGVFITNNTIPILFQPENKITNGKSLLKFKDWPFSFTNEVQPIILNVQRPIFDVAVTHLESTHWSDMFWYLFSPVTVYNLCFLPVIEKGEMSDVEFAEEVRKMMARELKVELYNFSATDVAEWEKRYVLEQRRARMVHSPTSSSISLTQNNPELHRMARQVKEVLPMVPYNVIFKDLVRTKNVDVTITNILEGQVLYTPETVAPATSVSPTSLQAATSSTGTSSTNNATDSKEINGKDFNTSSPVFHRSAQERMLSFQERKLQLIMNARKRYMDKHGLNALASNDC